MAVEVAEGPSLGRTAGAIGQTAGAGDMAPLGGRFDRKRGGIESKTHFWARLLLAPLGQRSALAG